MHGLEIHAPQALVEGERNPYILPLRVVGDFQKRVIDGGRNHDLLLCFEAACGHVHAGHYTGKPNHPFLWNRPFIMVLKPTLKRLSNARWRFGVANDWMVEPCAQCSENKVRHREVHISDPERQNVSAGVFFPLSTVAVATINYLVKVVHGLVEST